MRLLAFDCCLAGCSVAVVDAGRVLAGRGDAMARGQAERLVPMVRETMAASGLAWAGLDLIAVTVGPGSFTGVRVGLAAARAMAMAANRPLAGVTVMEALAAAVPRARLEGRHLGVALDARRGRIFFQEFDSRRRPRGPARLVERVGLAAAGAAMLVIGDGADAFTGLADLDAGPLRVDARHVAAVAARRHGPEGEPLPARFPAPLFLREPDALRPDEVAPIVLSAAGAGHLAEIAALHGRCFDEARSADSVARLLDNPGALALLARLDRTGAAVGFALLLTAADEAELVALGVLPERRRRGIAQRLVAACLDRCRAAGVRRVALEVAEGNLGARRLFARAGFRPVGRRGEPVRYDAPATGDAVTLARDLA